MGWKATGQPTVRKQRDRWVVRLDGIDTETGKHRPRQLGTYASQRAARTAASAFASERAEGSGKGTVGWLVDRWVAADRTPRADTTTLLESQWGRAPSSDPRACVAVVDFAMQLPDLDSLACFVAAAVFAVYASIRASITAR